MSTHVRSSKCFGKYSIFKHFLRTGIFSNFGKGPYGLSDWENSRGWENCYNVILRHFWSLKKIAIPYTTCLLTLN